jgi:hypothetical protein
MKIRKIKKLRKKIEDRRARQLTLESQLDKNIQDLKQAITKNKEYYGRRIKDEELAIAGLMENVHLLQQGEDVKVAY